MRAAILAIVLGSVFVVGSVGANEWAPASKQANAGDSISQGFGANGWPGDHPDLSWVQGTDDRVDSTAERLASAYGSGFTEEAESVTGAEMVGGDDNFPAQAMRICAQTVKPTRVRVLLGGNDVCNRAHSASDDATANLYSTETFLNAFRAGIDQLIDCLPPKSVVQVLSFPRVDKVYDAGHAKSAWCYLGVWPLAGVCRIVTAEPDSDRRAQIGDAVDTFNDALAAEVEAYATNANGKNPGGLGFFTDWAGSIASGHQNTSIGTYVFTKDDINGVDCFHPNVGGQARLACVAWSKSPDTTSSSSACFSQ